MLFASKVVKAVWHEMQQLSFTAEANLKIKLITTSFLEGKTLLLEGQPRTSN